MSKKKFKKTICTAKKRLYHQRKSAQLEEHAKEDLIAITLVSSNFHHLRPAMDR